MKTSTIIIGIIVLIVIVGAFLIADTSTTTENPTQNAKTDSTLDAAPSFSLENYDGETVSLSDFDGKVRVVNSWATWCPFCVEELPDFVELQEEFGDDIVVIAIDRRESKKTAKAFTDSLDISDDLIYLLDPTDSFYRSIGGFAMPETLFIDTQGHITFHKRGFMTLEEMREHTENALAG